MRYVAACADGHALPSLTDRIAPGWLMQGILICISPAESCPVQLISQLEQLAASANVVQGTAEQVKAQQDTAQQGTAAQADRSTVDDSSVTCAHAWSACTLRTASSLGPSQRPMFLRFHIL